MTGSLTILRAVEPSGAVLVKRFGAGGVAGYDKAVRFDVSVAQVDGLMGLRAVLADLEGASDCCVIRGVLKPDTRPQRVLRRHRGEGAAFDDVPLSWLCLDVDGLFVPADLRGQVECTPRALAEWVAGQMPEQLADVGCIVQWSASAFTGNPWKLSAHLWYWLDEPVSTGALRAQAGRWRDEGRDWLDPSIIRCVQPHYTGAPIFSGHWSDPVPSGERLVLVTGMDRAASLGSAESDWRGVLEARASRVLASGEGTPPEMAQVASALEALDPDCSYERWVELGMAIHSEFPGDEGLTAWDRWSSKGSKYEPGGCDYKWRSFTPGAGIGVGTLFHHAQEAGWARPAADRHAPRVDARADWTGDVGDPGEPPPGWGVGVVSGARAEGGEALPAEETLDEVEAGKHRYTFGEDVWQITASGEDAQTARLLARRVWPVAVVQDVDTGSRGLLYRYRDRGGRLRQGVMPGEAWVDRSPARRAAEDAARAGVAIEPYQGVAFVIAMGRWASDSAAPWNASVATGGWRRHEGKPVYTAAPETYGAPWVWSGERADRDRRGGLAEWISECEWACAGSKAMTLTLAVAFGGALIEPLGQGSFMVHLFGGSSTGKTIAELIGTTVWGNPMRPASWKDTGNYLLEMLPLHSGRCMTIDDLRKAGNPRSVATLILALSDNMTKGRLSRTGQRKDTNRFALTVLSSGEQSMGAYLGELDDAGHGVRCIDVPIDLGDSTANRDHAKRCERWLGSGSYGVAGPAFAKALVDTLRGEGGLEDIAGIVDRYVAVASRVTGGHATNDRIAYNLALSAAALELAQKAGVAPDTGVSPEEMLLWAVGKVCNERGREVSPEERCLVELLGRVAREPMSYPTARQFEQKKPSPFGGIFEPEEGKLYVTEALLKPLVKDMRVTARSWTKWLASQGYSTPPERSFRIGTDPALNGRWHTLDMAKCQGGAS